MKKRRPSVLLAAALTMGSLTHAGILVVPTQHGTIQEAIDAAQPGDTILIRGGTHTQFTIDKPLTLVGDPTPRIYYEPDFGFTGPPVPPTIVLAGDGTGVVVLHNLLVEGIGVLFNSPPGVPGPTYLPLIDGGGFEELHVHDCTVLGESYVLPAGDCCHTGGGALRTSVPWILVTNSTVRSGNSDSGICGPPWARRAPAGIEAPGSRVLVLDSTVSGGGYTWFCSVGGCSTTAFATSYLSPGIVAVEVIDAGSTIEGGAIGSFLAGDAQNPTTTISCGPGPSAAPTAGARTQLVDDLRAGGELGLDRNWTVSWSATGAFCVLLLTRDATLPPEPTGYGPLFLNLDPMVAFPPRAFLGTGPKTFLFRVPIRAGLIGVELFAQVFDPDLGYTRPVADCIGAAGIVPAPPRAAFLTLPPSGPPPLSVRFVDRSAGMVSAWAWDFGDGTSSTLQSPLHIYTSEGTYNPTLTVTGPGGSDSAQATIHAYHPPVAGFTAVPTSSPAPAVVEFTDTSTGAILAWYWDFGDGTSSTQQNPFHLYLDAGVYTVTLSVTGLVGSDSHVETITVLAPPVAAFEADPTLGTPPLTVSFTDLSTGTIQYWGWTFGDGQISSLRNPTHTYTSTGLFTVTLIVSGPAGMDRAETTIRVDHPPSADFTANPTSGGAPLAVNFTDQSMGTVIAWDWNFGDGTTSTMQNPTHVYSAPGAYTATLTVTGFVGSDSHVETITAYEPPSAIFLASPSKGPPPLEVTFIDLSSGPITSWDWDFGDGTSSTMQNPTHTYGSIWTYVATLTVSGPGGSDSAQKIIYVDNPPVADFTANPTSGAVPLFVAFSDQSTGTLFTWAWDFGDGTSSTMQNPTHVYPAPGSYTVTLTVTGPVGSDSHVDTVSAFEAPSALFLASPSKGPPPLEVTFLDLSSGAVTSWDWNFGDGATSTLQYPTHTYTSLGTYFATLTVSGPGGSDSAEKTIYVEHPPVAAFLAIPDSGMAPLSVNFYDVSTGTVLAWDWDFGDGTGSTLQHPTHTFDLPGVYTVALSVTSPLGSDTHLETITVSAPTP